MQAEKDAETLNKIYASVRNLSKLTTGDSAKVSAAADQLASLEAGYTALHNQIGEVGKRIDQLAAAVDEEWNMLELKRQALELLIQKLKQQ